MYFAFAAGVGGRVSSLEEVVVDLIDPTGAGIADLAAVGRPLQWLCLLGGRLVIDCLVRLKRLITPDPLLDLIHRLQLQCADTAI